MKDKWLYFTGVILVVILIFILKAGVFRSVSNKPSNKLQVSASFYPLYFFSSQIGADKAEVKNITPFGLEPHDYEPSLQDIARIENGNMLVLNGGIETWGDKIKNNLKGKGVKVIVAGEGLFTKEQAEGRKKNQDSHIWLSPKLAKEEARKITEGYISIDPANSSYYKENGLQLDNKLDQLDSDYKKGLANCQSRDIVTSHAAFAYLADAYGLNQVPISGLSPDEEPSAQQLADIAKFAKEHNTKYIFFESLVSPKLSETIANEIGAKTLVLDPIEGISDDDINKFAPSQSSGVKQGKNYFTVMEDNLKNLQIALQCR